MSKPGQIIPPENYPQMMGKGEGVAAAHMLRSPGTAQRGARVIENQTDTLRSAVLALVNELENSRQDHAKVAKIAHEIRGLAGTSGLIASGTIANGLCRYFDEIEQLGIAPDEAVVGLHVKAIITATRNPDETSHMSDTVSKELAALVAHRLSEIKALLTPPRS